MHVAVPANPRLDGRAHETSCRTCKSTGSACSCLRGDFSCCLAHDLKGQTQACGPRSAHLQILRDGLQRKSKQGLQRLGSILRLLRICTEPRFQLLKGVPLQHHLSLLLDKFVDVHSATCGTVCLISIAAACDLWWTNALCVVASLACQLLL